MRLLCTELECGRKRTEKPIYENLFQDLRGWYLQQHTQYEVKLKNDMLSELSKQFEDQLKYWDQLAMKGYTENSSAKSDLFDRTEQTCKLMLSLYSYGPDSSCPAQFSKSKLGKSWLNTDLAFPHIIELLQAQLQAHNEGSNINLATFTEEKSVRNVLTHQGRISTCVSAIRCYNILRDMLIFLEPECSSRLPRFMYPDDTACDTQLLMSRLCDFNFLDAESTMLVVGPLHDLPSEALATLANLPWTVVVDLDGCSSFGGLRSVARFPNINDQKLQLSTARNFKAKREFTTWFTCGEFSNYTYYQPVNVEAKKRIWIKKGFYLTA